MITRTAHVGIYVKRSPDGLEHKHQLVAQLYTGRIMVQGDCLEGMSLPNSLRCATYLDFGKTVLDRVPYTFTRKEKQPPQLVIFHPGLKSDTEPVSKDQLDRIAEGAMRSFRDSLYKVAFRTDETPINLG